MLITLIEGFVNNLMLKNYRKICLPKQTSNIIFSLFEQKICSHNDMHMFSQWLENRKRGNIYLLIGKITLF